MRAAISVAEARRFLDRLEAGDFHCRYDPWKIPCRETSDAVRLCKAPLVSVLMITYNHEKYLARAIEGVMMQRTDFEFELVLGEDCSSDRTREICFEYQKRYPERIRVLWADVNVHRIGGNAMRCTVRCRGRYTAHCEGDDYWTDPDKLQKQIDVFRSHPGVGLCLAGTDILHEGDTERMESFAGGLNGLVKSREAIPLVLSKGRSGGRRLRRMNWQTSGWMVDGRYWLKAVERLPEAYYLELAFGDTITLSLMALVSDLWFIGEAMSVYRVHGGGLSAMATDAIVRDRDLYRLYWHRRVDGWSRPRLLALTVVRRIISAFSGK